MSDRFSRVSLEINLNAARQNMLHMLNGISPSAKIAAVVKKDGYGSGAVEIARAVDDLERVWGYCTATYEEAADLREAGITKPILILGYVYPYCYKDLAEKEIIPAVFREDMLTELSEAALNAGKDIQVFLAVDTGMTRIGVTPDEEGLSFAKKLNTMPGIKFAGIFTHFAKADEKDLTYAKLQQERFAAFTSKVKETLQREDLIISQNNSAGTLILRDSDYDLCRAGITLYGMWPSDEMDKDCIDLHPVLSFYSSIVYIKKVKAGVPVSYGGTYITSRDTVIATVSAGYGDGYPRQLSGKGACVLVNGRRAPILGRICMDQFMIDVTDIPDAALGDRVTLIGKDGTEEITIEELGALSGRFNYELACNLDKRVPRKYIRE